MIKTLALQSLVLTVALTSSKENKEALAGSVLCCPGECTPSGIHHRGVKRRTLLGLQHKVSLSEAILLQWNLFPWGHPWPGPGWKSLHTVRPIMEVKSTDGCIQTVLCALIESLLSMRSMLEAKKKGKTQRLSVEKSNIPSTSLPQLHRLLWRGPLPPGKMAMYLGKNWRHHVGHNDLNTPNA